MNPELVFINLFLFNVIIGMFFFATTLIGAGIYDALQVKKLKQARQNPFSKAKRHRPVISVIIPAFNEASVIERCLDNLRSSRYRKLEIIVSDDGSKDATRAIVRRYIRENPKRNIRLTWRNKQGGRGAAINQGVKKANGEIIVAYDADCMIDKNSFKNLARYFIDPKVVAVAANVRIMDNGSVLGWLQQFEYLVSYRGKKFNTISNSEFMIGGAGAAYRRSILKTMRGFDDRMKTEDIDLSLRIANAGNKKYGLVYASDYLIHTEPVPTFKALLKQRYRWKFGSLQAIWHSRSIFFNSSKDHSKFLTFVKLPFAMWCELMLLMEPFYFIYFTYLAVQNENATLFVSSCLALSVIINLAVWSDEHFAKMTKIRMTFFAPTMYVVFSIMTLVQIVSALRCLANVRAIAGIKHISGAYQSTERVKGELGVVS